jgi:hypothetical protein
MKQRTLRRGRRSQGTHLEALETRTLLSYDNVYWYDSYGSSAPFIIDGGTYDWSNTKTDYWGYEALGPYNSESTTLEITGLPEHSAVDIWIEFGVYHKTDYWDWNWETEQWEVIEPANSGPDTIKVTSGSTVLMDETWDDSEDVDYIPHMALSHSGNSLTLEIEGLGFDQDESWWITYIAVGTYTNEIWLGGAGKIVEGGQGRTLQVRREGSTMLPLDVQLEYSGGGESEVVTLPSQVTFNKGQSIVEIPVTAVDDSELEWTELLVVQVQESDDYLYHPLSVHGDYPWSIDVEIVDNDSISIGNLPETLWVNNDDDNENGISDSDETGGVSGEDDLYELTLEVPQDIKPGARVSLSAPPMVKLWADSGKQTRLGDGRNVTWVYGQDDSPPASVWVEAVNGSTQVGDVILLAQATDSETTHANGRPTSSPTTTQSQTDATSFFVGISQHQQNITGKEIVKFAGEPMLLDAILEGPGTDTSTVLWNVEGKCIADYVATQNVGVVIPLDDDLLDDKKILFYWIDGTNDGSARNVKLTAHVGNQSISRTATFNVKKPTNVRISAQVGDVYIGDAPDPTKYLLAFRGEFVRDDIYLPGISFQSSGFDQNTFPGQLQWVQTFNFSERRHKLAGNPNWFLGNLTAENGPFLDTNYPYSRLPSTEDSPYTRFEKAAFTVVERHDSATMTLMWQSSTPGSIPVSLRELDWFWKASAELGPNGWIAGPSDHSDNPQDAATDELPTWKHNLEAYLKYKEQT